MVNQSEWTLIIFVRAGTRASSAALTCFLLSQPPTVVLRSVATDEDNISRRWACLELSFLARGTQCTPYGRLGYTGRTWRESYGFAGQIAASQSAV